MDIRSPVNMLTRYELWPMLIDDYWFTETALFSRLRDNIEPFTGGQFTKSLFRYRSLPAFSYKMGSSWDITKVPTIGEQNFPMKYYICNVPEFLEELEVINKGPNADFSILDEDLSNGLASVSNNVAINFWDDAVDDPTSIDGLGLAIGDGILPNWKGNILTSYGGASRAGTYGSILNGQIHWFGNEAGGVAAPTLLKMGAAYRSVSRGPISPDLIVTTKWAHELCLNEINSLYRIDQSVQDPYWGGDGFKFRKAIVVADEYAPSLSSGLTDDENFGLGNYKTGSFANPLAGTPKNGFPNSTAAANLTVGETMWFLNTEWMKLRISDSEEFGFGFSGFMQLPDSTKVNGQIKAAINGILHGGRYQAMAYGIG
jgi:hypothetical protein